jgi:branched-chain amino acid transport system substrate-binding protein
MRDLRKWLATIVVVGSAATVVACGGNDSSGAGSAKSGGGGANAGPVKIAVILSLTGPVSAFGNLAKDGVELGVADINANGGINGRKLQAEYFDDTSRPEKATALAQQVTSDDSFVAAVAGSTVATGPAMMPIINSGKLPAVSLFGDADQSVDPGPYVFKTAATFDQHADALLAYVKDQLGKSKVALEYQGNEYGAAVAEGMKKTAPDEGLQLVATESIDPNTTEATPAVRKALGSNPDVLISNNTTNIAPVVSAWKALGTSVPLILGIGASAAANLEAADKQATGLPVLAVFSGDSPLERQKAMADAYRAAKGKSAQYNNATGWDSVHLLAEAMKRASELTREGVKAGMEQTTDYQGAGGIYTFKAGDHQGFAPDGWMWLRYAGGGKYDLDPAWAKSAGVAP